MSKSHWGSSNVFCFIMSDGYCGCGCCYCTQQIYPKEKHLLISLVPTEATRNAVTPSDYM